MADSITDETVQNAYEVYLVNDDSDTAIGVTNLDDVSIEVGEETVGRELHSDPVVQTVPGRRDAQISFTGFISESAEALDEFGFRDPANEGIMPSPADEGREWDAAEVWVFASDADPTVDAADMIHRAEDVLWVFDGEISLEQEGQGYEATGHINGDFYPHYEPAA